MVTKQSNQNNCSTKTIGYKSFMTKQFAGRLWAHHGDQVGTQNNCSTKGGFAVTNIGGPVRGGFALLTLFVIVLNIDKGVEE